jgi:LysR family glycine cleavage system transcriptional activator
MAQLPNFAALRAFEAAARHQNFSRAADELHLTHGAISHQVRALEEELGRALFVRNGRQVSVTADGRAFAQVLGRAFADIGAAAELLRPGRARKRLTISAVPSFAARWLAPRLGRFIDQHPDTEVVLHSVGQLQDLAREEVDVGLRYGHGHYPGLVVERLMGDSFYPAVSPRYNGARLPATPQDLQHATLLRSDEPWVDWFRVAGVHLPEPSGGLMFKDLSMLIRSTVDGNGVALVRHVVAMQEIASGELVRLFDIEMPSSRDYFFVCPPGALAKPQVQAFRAWLLAEVAKFEAQPGA